MNKLIPSSIGCRHFRFCGRHVATAQCLRLLPCMLLTYAGGHKNPCRISLADFRKQLIDHLLRLTQIAGAKQVEVVQYVIEVV
ncbi:hypothetical protein SAMN05216316_3005 [Nitrosovibrio sp. Nv6]|nr:hypothetical protein SAMN05216316_3005 [Nitrosovibrio sp. Nv6]